MAQSDSEKDKFLVEYKDFSLREVVEYPNGGTSHFFENGKDMVIIDNGICDLKQGEQIFSYTLITDKQNQYMHEFGRLFRFYQYDFEKIEYFLNCREVSGNVDYVVKVTDRADNADASPLELLFEKNFSSVYGMNAIKYLNREYGILDETGKNYFLDYYLRTNNGDLAIEENGVYYHHPQIIGADRYRRQLQKQNTCALWGVKLYRFSTEDCKFESRIEDDIRSYFGKDASNFRENGLVVNRKVELYEHQSVSLEEIVKKREAGIKVFLIVLPTAAGKSRIVEEDIQEFSKEKDGFRALILAPGTNTVEDWKIRVKESLPGLNIDIFTYSYMARHFTEFQSDYYNYVIVDEAHHAVAPILKRVIQYFEPEFLLGLTATDQRPDRKRLEGVFGGYSTNLSLQEAMEKGIVATANVYRIETNIDLSHVRFNGKDYVNADLEKSIRVTSRNELIVNVLKEYFTEGEAAKRQGVIFCVNISHAREMVRLMNAAGISAENYTRETKNPEKIMQAFKERKIRFLCACNMISEGWDYPELGILVMARPTLSRVLYLQQIGRGLRKTDKKKNVFIIDVVDEYGAMVKACSLNAIFGNSFYSPFGDITRRDYAIGDFIEIDGIKERIERIIEIDIDTFEEKYGDYYNQEQLAREYFVSTGTVSSWIKKGKIKPTTEYSFGSKKIYLFSPQDVERYRIELEIKEHSDETIKDDFYSFLEERDYSLSYKMPFILALTEHINAIGDAKIDEILKQYIEFYKDRISRGLPVDKATCPYNEKTLEDFKAIRSSMLANPFEKLERKRFLYYSKDLNTISMNHALFSKISKEDWNRIRKQMNEDLENYYMDMGGV